MRCRLRLFLPFYIRTISYWKSIIIFFYQLLVRDTLETKVITELDHVSYLYTKSLCDSVTHHFSLQNWGELVTAFLCLPAFPYLFLGF